MAVYIKATGETMMVSPRDGRGFDLEEMQHLVGGYIEVIPLPGEQAMVVNEHGKLHGQPLNEEATSIAQLTASIHWSDYIVGDVVVCQMNEI